MADQYPLPAWAGQAQLARDQAKSSATAAAAANTAAQAALVASATNVTATAAALAALNDASFLANVPFTPNITSTYRNDLVVAIGASACTYTKRGFDVDLVIRLTFTLTRATAAGDFIINGLPFAADSSPALSPIPLSSSTAFTWPAGATSLTLQPAAGATTATIVGQGSGVAGAAVPVASFVSGTPYTLSFRGRYRSST